MGYASLENPRSFPGWEWPSSVPGVMEPDCQDFRHLNGIAEAPARSSRRLCWDSYVRSWSLGTAGKVWETPNLKCSLMPPVHSSFREPDGG